MKGPMSVENIQNEHTLRYRLDKLEAQKNTYGKQRAHVEWLMNGDRNTRVFHASATQRKIVNKINRLRQENGVWVEEPELNNFIAQQYK
jgi:hypothetical protein